MFLCYSLGSRPCHACWSRCSRDSIRLSDPTQLWEVRVEVEGLGRQTSHPVLKVSRATDSGRSSRTTQFPSTVGAMQVKDEGSRRATTTLHLCSKEEC
jgi:hypothetical protein